MRDYDYSSPGYYFVTICVKNKTCCLGKIVAGEDRFITGEIKLSELGRIVNDVWLSIPEHHKVVELAEFVIMPNHIHGIIGINDMDFRRGIARNTPERGDPQALCANHRRGVARYAPTNMDKRCFIKQPSGSLSTIIGSFKSEESRRIHVLPKWKNFSWQRNYYEHIIDSEKSLEYIRYYIENNPIKWYEDINNPKNRFTEYQIKYYYK